jgi:hypothetical protein
VSQARDGAPIHDLEDASFAFFNLNSRVGFCGFWLSGAPN